MYSRINSVDGIFVVVNCEENGTIISASITTREGAFKREVEMAKVVKEKKAVLPEAPYRVDPDYITFSDALDNMGSFEDHDEVESEEQAVEAKGYWFLDANKKGMAFNDYHADNSFFRLFDTKTEDEIAMDSDEKRENYLQQVMAREIKITIPKTISEMRELQKLIRFFQEVKEEKWVSAFWTYVYSTKPSKATIEWLKKAMVTTKEGSKAVSEVNHSETLSLNEDAISNKKASDLAEFTMFGATDYGAVGMWSIRWMAWAWRAQVPGWITVRRFNRDFGVKCAEYEARFYEIREKLKAKDGEFAAAHRLLNRITPKLAERLTRDHDSKAWSDSVRKLNEAISNAADRVREEAGLEYQLEGIKIHWRLLVRMKDYLTADAEMLWDLRQAMKKAARDGLELGTSVAELTMVPIERSEDWEYEARYTSIMLECHCG